MHIYSNVLGNSNIYQHRKVKRPLKCPIEMNIFCYIHCMNYISKLRKRIHFYVWAATQVFAKWFLNDLCDSQLWHITWNVNNTATRRHGEDEQEIQSSPRPIDTLRKQPHQCNQPRKWSLDRWKRLSSVNHGEEDILKSVGRAEMQTGTKVPVRLKWQMGWTSHAQRRDKSIPYIKHPRHREPQLRKQFPLTFGFEKQWGLTSSLFLDGAA